MLYSILGRSSSHSFINPYMHTDTPMLIHTNNQQFKAMPQDSQFFEIPNTIEKDRLKVRDQDPCFAMSRYRRQSIHMQPSPSLSPSPPLVWVLPLCLYHFVSTDQIRQAKPSVTSPFTACTPCDLLLCIHPHLPRQPSVSYLPFQRILVPGYESKSKPIPHPPPPLPLLGLLNLPQAPRTPTPPNLHLLCALVTPIPLQLVKRGGRGVDRRT